jgi:hypothetical protein
MVLSMLESVDQTFSKNILKKIPKASQYST